MVQNNEGDLTGNTDRTEKKSLGRNSILNESIYNSRNKDLPIRRDESKQSDSVGSIQPF